MRLVPSEMVRLTDWIVLRVIEKVYHVICFIFHGLLSAAYWTRGKKVPPVQNPILQMSGTELAEQIRERTLTSEMVVRAFIDRILEVEPYINATVDRRFNEALKEAREIDNLIVSGKMSKEDIAKEKPLLGVPFTVKVLITVKGMRCTGASLLYKDVLAQEDAVVVFLMKKAGAIVLATTNSAEFGMNFETNNFAHGTTSNPYDTRRTSGGSSGGESAIVAAAGSVIGIGNDLAGSIRVPCMFTCLFGHKPTMGLVSNDGCFPNAPAKLKPMIATGPMCRYAKDLETTMKILTSEVQMAPKFGLPVNFQDIKVYYMLSFGDLPLTKPVDDEIQQAIKKVVAYFENKYDIKGKEISIPLLKLSNLIYVHLLLGNAGNVADVFTSGKGSIDGTLELLKMLLRQSPFSIGPLVAMNATSIPLLYRPNKVDYYRKVTKKIDDELNNLLDDNSILVIPTLPFSAPFHNEMPLLLPSTCYTHMFNALGHPVTQVPVGLDKKGMPIGVQVLSKKYNDPLTIACGIELEKAFGGWIPPK